MKFFLWSLLLVTISLGGWMYYYSSFYNADKCLEEDCLQQQSLCELEGQGCDEDAASF